MSVKLGFNRDNANIDAHILSSVTFQTSLPSLPHRLADATTVELGPSFATEHFLRPSKRSQFHRFGSTKWSVRSWSVWRTSPEEHEAKVTKTPNFFLQSLESLLKWFFTMTARQTPGSFLTAKSEISCTVICDFWQKIYKCAGTHVHIYMCVCDLCCSFVSAANMKELGVLIVGTVFNETRAWSQICKNCSFSQTGTENNWRSEKVKVPNGYCSDVSSGVFETMSRAVTDKQIKTMGLPVLFPPEHEKSWKFFSRWEQQKKINKSESSKMQKIHTEKVGQPLSFERKKDWACTSRHFFFCNSMVNAWVVC